jgi:hypothetical protein
VILPTGPRISGRVEFTNWGKARQSFEARVEMRRGTSVGPIADYPCLVACRLLIASGSASRAL